MSKINDYVENMFYGLPKTEDVIETKRGIIENMEDKYAYLLAHGKSEDEAFGAVVSEFGSIEELARERGWKTDAESTTSQKSWNYEKGGKRVNITFDDNDDDDDDDDDDKHEDWHGNSSTKLASSIIMSLATIAFFILGAVFNMWHPAWLLFPVCGILCGVINMIGEKRATGRLHVGGIIMSLAVAGYLVLGFVFHLWHPGWVIFPVCGILSGIFEKIEADNRRKNK